jgi:hypothetical protein
MQLAHRIFQDLGYISVKFQYAGTFVDLPFDDFEWIDL